MKNSTIPVSYRKVDTPFTARVSSPLHLKKIRMLKRGFDLSVSSLLLIPFFIVLPFIAMLVKLGSKGPVFFLQKRNKKDGQVFTCIKFRTMTVSITAQRITGTGRFLRKYHLDELPQLLNVWWGDMSIIGPRPHMLADNQKFDSLVDSYNERHSVKPGMTGLAQVLGYIGPVAQPDDIRNRVEKDLLYIAHWSPAMELRIIYGSLLKVTGKKMIASSSLLTKTPGKKIRPFNTSS